jgi:hypothetical protein
MHHCDLPSRCCARDTTGADATRALPCKPHADARSGLISLTISLPNCNPPRRL